MRIRILIQVNRCQCPYINSYIHFTLNIWYFIRKELKLQQERLWRTVRFCSRLRLLVDQQVWRQRALSTDPQRVLMRWLHNRIHSMHSHTRKVEWIFIELILGLLKLSLSLSNAMKCSRKLMTKIIKQIRAAKPRLQNTL